MFYPESVIEITFLERNVRNMCAEGKNAGHVLFNCMIYLVRQKRPFSGSAERFKFFKLQEKNLLQELKNAIEMIELLETFYTQ